MNDDEFVPINETIKDGAPHLVRRGPDYAVAYWRAGEWLLGRPEHGPPTVLSFQPSEYRADVESACAAIEAEQTDIRPLISNPRVTIEPKHGGLGLKL